MMTNPLSNTFTQRCRYNSRECAKWVISLFSIKYSIWQRHDKRIKFSAHIDNGKTLLSLPRLSRPSVSDGKDALCSDRVKAPPLWDEIFGMWSSTSAFLKLVSRARELHAADAFLFALVPRAVDSEWFNRARQHRFTVRRRAASLKRVPGISYRRAEARRVRGGARDTPLSRAGAWGKSFSCLNAFLKFQNRVKSNIMSSMTG